MQVLLLVSVTNDNCWRLWEVELCAEILCPPENIRFSAMITILWAEEILKKALVILNMQNQMEKRNLCRYITKILIFLGLVSKANEKIS